MTGNIMRQEQDRVNHLVAEMEDNNASPTEQLVSTLLINVLLFVLLTATFELLRRKKSIYLNRRVSRFIESTPLPRVPPNPDSYPFAWVRLLNDVTDQDILDMVGLDGYICMRYIGICLRTALFCSFFGLSTLVPIYAHSGNELTGWDRYTVANVAEGRHASRLWATALSCYLFAGFFCHLMFQEYKNFIIKRVQYLVQGDNDTPVQTYYTAMVERVPSQLRSGPMLGAFFEHLFPGEFHCAEVAIELHDLEQLTAQRKRKRSTLEKSIALCNADKARPTVWKKAADLHFGPLGSMKAVAENRLADRLGLVVVDAIEYHMKRLSVMNAQVAALRTEYLAQREYLDKEEEARVQQMRLIKKKGRTAWSALKARVTPKSLHKSTLVLARPLSGSGSEPSTTPVNSPTPVPASSNAMQGQGQGQGPEGREATPKTGTRAGAGVGAGAGAGTGAGVAGSLMKSPSGRSVKKSPHPNSLMKSPSGRTLMTPMTTRDSLSVEDARSPIDRISPIRSTRLAVEKEGVGEMETWAGEMGDEEGGQQETLPLLQDSAAAEPIPADPQYKLHCAQSVCRVCCKGVEAVGKAAFRGVCEVVRALELLTFGAYYRVSSTAFVTFKSRVAKCQAQQMLLSHEHYSMKVSPAPNPRDVVWDNVSIPEAQISLRTSIADGTLIVGALFWSACVTFITYISNLQNIGQMMPWVQKYQDTMVYNFLNNYMTMGLLLVLLAVLPYLFDFIARDYEGIKTESEIQNSIMTRYFYYQLANVYVSVGLGSLASSLREILADPLSILNILGTSVPSFSIYFANLVIIKTFTAVPIEMLRVFPLLQIQAVTSWMDKNKCTRRELRTGCFADPPMLYGWIYPNLMMVLMILGTYCCIAPVLSPLCALFFALAYLMYKYQLLYVYINLSQAGGFMWYAVFDRSMVVLLAGVVTLLCYLAIRSSDNSGPFFVLFPLPFMIGFFWHHCETRIKGPALTLSMEGALQLDKDAAEAQASGQDTPHKEFKKECFRQPALAAGGCKPALYRSNKPMLPMGLEGWQPVRQSFSGRNALGSLVSSLNHRYQGESSPDASPWEYEGEGRSSTGMGGMGGLGMGLSPMRKSPMKPVLSTFQEQDEEDSRRDSAGSAVTPTHTTSPCDQSPHLSHHPTMLPSHSLRGVFEPADPTTPTYPAGASPLDNFGIDVDAVDVVFQDSDSEEEDADVRKAVDELLEEQASRKMPAHPAHRQSVTSYGSVDQSIEEDIDVESASSNVSTHRGSSAAFVAINLEGEEEDPLL